MFGFKEINETNEIRQNLTVTTKITKEKDRFELPPIESLPPIMDEVKWEPKPLPDVSELPPIYSLPPIEELLPLLEPVNKE